MSARFLTVGDTLADAIEVTDAAGDFADPGTGPTCTMTLPSGSTAAATVTKTATGKYTATYASSTAGRHVFTWAASGANSSDFPHQAVRDVADVDARLVIDIDDARDALNIPTGTRVADDELRLYVAAATVVCESLYGPILVDSKTATVSGSYEQCIDLWQQPTAITSVTEDGVTLDASGYCFDEHARLWRGSAPGAAIWSGAAPRNVAVVYTVGDPVVPPQVRLAARELVRFWWQSGQIAGRPSFNTDTPGGPYYMTAGYAVPNAVADKLMADTSRKVWI